MASSSNSDEVQSSISAGSTVYEQVIQKIRKCSVDVLETLKFILCPDHGDPNCSPGPQCTFLWPTEQFYAIQVLLK